MAVADVDAFRQGPAALITNQARRSTASARPQRTEAINVKRSMRFRSVGTSRAYRGLPLHTFPTLRFFKETYHEQ